MNYLTISLDKYILHQFISDLKNQGQVWLYKSTVQFKQEISLKKIFVGSQILTKNATKFAGLNEIPIYPFVCWNLKPAKLCSCFCLSFAWFCAHLTLFAERYASESFFFNFRHSPARVWEQCFKSLVFRNIGVGGGGWG